jgi:seryl-tRNA synthetase
MTSHFSSNPNMQRQFPGIHVTTDGRAAFSGVPLKLFTKLEKKFFNMALESEAEEHSFPSLIDNQVLHCAGYFKSFPEGATVATAPGLSHDCSLSPAVCYHCYPCFAQSPLQKEVTWTCQGRCFRHEKGNYEGLARLWEFTMREIVFCGSEDWVKQQREDWMKRVLRFCEESGFSARLEESTDPFYGAASRGQQLLQRLKKLKYELRLNLADGTTTAAASFNLHESHFTETFGITSGSGRPLQTGCVAFGLERWVLAALEQWDETRIHQFLSQTN